MVSAVLAFSRSSLILLLLMLTGIAPGMAQSWPSKPVRIIVPYVPGGPTDALTRLVQPRLSELLGQPVIIENKPGAGGNIGLDAMAKSEPDGYALVMVVQSNVVLGPLVNKNLPFDIDRDLTPVAILSEAPTLYATGMSTPVTDMRGLIALAKAKPGQLFYATNGNGSSQHINVARLQKQAGFRMTDIAYKGDGAALLALAAGDIQLHAGTANSYIALAKAGKIRVLGVASDKRSKVFPDVPTMAEQGIPFRHGSWFGYMTRKGVPADITARLNREFNRITRMQDVQAQIIALGMEPVQITPKEMGDFIAAELTTWTPVVRELGLTN